MACETTLEMSAAIEDAYGIPRGLIARDPEAAAIIAIYGPQPEPTIGRLIRIPVAVPPVTE